MKGWMKYRYKGGFTDRLSGLRSEHQLYFVLTDGCMLSGYNEQTSLKSQKPEVSFDIRNAAITTKNERTNQFEITDNEYHVLFTLERASEALDWISSLQLQRSLNRGDTSNPSSPVDSLTTTRNKSRNVNRSEKLNGEFVFDDPLSLPTPSSTSNFSEFEWDNPVGAAPVSPQLSYHGDSGAIFHLTEELSNVKQELEQYRQKVQSYQEVLTLRDRQLLQIRDEMSNSESHVTNPRAWSDLEEQVRSYREQNALLNEEILKLHQMHNKSAAEAKTQTKRADNLRAELRKFQRDYLAALSGCVRRPLVDPDDGAYFDIPDREYHIRTLKSLSRGMKSKNDRILGCSIPSLGKTEHVDAFSFIHSLPNDALQIQYLCLHLYEAYTALMEMDDENQKNLRKWKSCIMDGSEEFEVTPNLRKLVQQGVPSQYRAYLWQKLIYYYVSDMRKKREENYFEVLVGQQALLKDDKNFGKYMKQIVMDVPRTMPNNKDYLVPDSVHKDRLRNVLIAFCIHSPAVGYCQGFNFLAGGCLLYLEEESAFWFLVAVTEKIFPPNYYRNGLAGLLADQYVLKEIISHNLPRLSEHLAKFPEVDLAAVTTGWFLGLFFDCLPFQTLIRVWDCFLAFGHEAVFRVAYAMFALFESRLLEFNELSQLLHASKNIPKLCTHPAQLIKEAFDSNFPRWEDIETMRFQIEEELIEKHERKMQQRRYYDQRLMLIEEDVSLQQKIPDDKWTFNCGAGGERFVFSASCHLNDNSQVFELDSNFIRQLRFPITSYAMCVSVVSDDVILVGMLTGQVQAYSCATSSLLWSMSLSDVVLCMLVRDRSICVGTVDGKLHFLEIVDPDRSCAVKPTHNDSIDLSKRPTTCCCYIEAQNSLWVASGPAIYVVNVDTNETDGFFLISSRIEKVSSMIHWSNYVLISIRGSSIIQLHGTEVFNNPPLLVYDVARQMTLSPLYPMMPDEGDSRSPTSHVVVCMVHVTDDVFWVGTVGGDVLMYTLETSDVSAPTTPTTTDDQPDRSENSLQIRHIKSQHASEHPVRCLLKSNSRIVSCAGYYTENNSVLIWNLDGDFSSPDASAPTLSSLEDAKSLASSSRSLDADFHLTKTDATTDAWKSMKSAAASAMKNLEKKPRFRRLMNMWGSNPGVGASKTSF